MTVGSAAWLCGSCLTSRPITGSRFGSRRDSVQQLSIQISNCRVCALKTLERHTTMIDLKTVNYLWEQHVC